MVDLPSDKLAETRRDKPIKRRWTLHILRWTLGALIATLIIAVTSPFFVRSYLPLKADAARGVWVLSPGQTYRWRSEGYANTKIGPNGFPGKATDWVGKGDQAIALWGDSQAEGVAVDDDEKLFRAIELESNGRYTVFPFCRSGEDAAVWATQMPKVDHLFHINAHVFLIVDLPDLMTLDQAPIPAPSADDVAAGRSALAARLPAFVIQAARHLLTEPDGTTSRKLRFSIGPQNKSVSNDSATMPDKKRVDWNGLMKGLREKTENPIIIAYVPKVPMIVVGTIQRDDPMSADFSKMKSAAEATGVIVLDLRDALLGSAEKGVWPHGFHNGRIGSGHLNADGYRVIGKAIADKLNEIFRSQENSQAKIDDTIFCEPWDAATIGAESPGFGTNRKCLRPHRYPAASVVTSLRVTAHKPVGDCLDTRPRHKSMRFVASRHGFFLKV